MRSYTCLAVMLITTASPVKSVSGLAADTVYVSMSPDISGTYVCDGTGDDVEIRQALGAGGDSTGHVVYLKGPATYMIATGGMYVASNTTVTGDSSAEVKIIAKAGWIQNLPLFLCAPGTEKITFHGFSINGNYTNNRDKNAGKGFYNLLYFPYSTHVTVHDMYLYDGCNDGLSIAYGAHVSFYNNRVDRLGRDALYAVECLYVEAFGNTITCQGNSALRASNTNHVSFHDNIINSASGSGPGIQIQKTDPCHSLSTDYPMDDIEIYNNVIHDTFGCGIWLLASSDTYNTGTYGRELTRDDVKNVAIHHNIFYGNGTNPYIAWVGGIVTAGFYDTRIENNVFDGCRNAAVTLMAGSGSEGTDISVPGSGFTTILRNNIIVNTLPGTYYSQGSGNGISNMLPENHSFILQNNCFYNNQSGNYYNTLPGTADLDTDPFFVDAANHDYHLQSEYGRWDNGNWVMDQVTSPCIDAGCDTVAYSNEPAPNGGRIDIGRYGNTVEASKSATSIRETQPILFHLGQNTPNPFNPSTAITYRLPSSGPVTLTIYNIAGQPIENLVNGTYSAGDHVVRWKPYGISSGVYLYRLKTETFTETKKLLYMK